LLGFAMFSAMLCIPPIEHIITEELLLSHAQMGLLFAIPVGILAVLAMPSGLLADRIGIRKAAGIGAIVMAVGALMRGTSTGFTMLLAFTCLYGVGLALVYPNLPKAVSGCFPQEKVGLATGIYSTGIATGGALALAITVPLVFPITNTFQGTFYIWSTPAIAAAILWWVVIKEPSSPYNGVQSQQLNLGNKLAYVVWKDRNLWLVAFMFFFNNIHYYTWSAWTPALMMMKGAPPDLAALITSVRGWAGVPVIFLIPWVSYKLGLRKPVLLALTIILACASWSAIYTSVSLGWLVMAIIGAATGGTFAMLLAFPVEIAPRKFAGAASGMVLSIGYMGGLVGSWLAGHIFDITGTLDPAILVLVGIAIAWSCITFIIPETGPKAK